MTIRAAHRSASAPAGAPSSPHRDVARAAGLDLGEPPGWVAAALERAELHFVTQVVRDGGIGPWRDQVIARFGAARSAGSGLSRADTAALLVALVDHAVRDRCWLRVEEDRHPDWVRLWRHLAGHARPPYRTEPLFLLAWSAWRTGDAVLARDAVDAVRAADATHRPAAMLDTMLAARLSPGDLPSLAGRDPAPGGPS